MHIYGTYTLKYKRSHANTRATHTHKYNYAHVFLSAYVNVYLLLFYCYQLFVLLILLSY